MSDAQDEADRKAFERLRRAWNGMKQRCFNKNNSSWKRYGGRGIAVCERWLTFSNFAIDMGVPPEGTSIDRIDNDGNYEPGNCRWATRAEQQRNTRDCIHIEFGGQRMTTEEWGRQVGVNPETIRRRLSRGMPLQEVLCPMRRRSNQFARRNDGVQKEQS